MTFEEDFPTLKNYACGYGYSCVKKRQVKHFDEYSIELACIDKARITKLLEDLKPEHGVYDPRIEGYEDALYEIKKELGC